MNKLFTLFTVLVISTCFGQQKSPAQIVQENLDFYNQRDLVGFSSLLSQDVKLFELGAKEPIASGWDAVTKLYQKLFQNSPQLHSTVLKRMVIGNKVIDHERIVGRNGVKQPLELVVIYEVNHQKISQLTVIRKEL